VGGSLELRLSRPTANGLGARTAQNEEETEGTLTKMLAMIGASSKKGRSGRVFTPKSGNSGSDHEWLSGGKGWQNGRVNVRCCTMGASGAPIQRGGELA
jgi:hypothetical protein